MDTKSKFALAKQVGEEIVQEEELLALIESDQPYNAYDGFEPSGQIHIAQGLFRTINVNKMIGAGAKFKMLIADWHGWANHKMGGDMGKIQVVGEYFKEVWKSCGMDMDNVEFVWASDLVKQEGYWETVMKIAIAKNLPRILRTVQIMGRSETDSLSASQIVYPLMQCADIFMLDAKVAQLGMDQRKVNMLAREVAPDLGYDWKPISVSHHMLMGLTPPDSEQSEESTVDRAIRLKMSKSNPDSAVFMTDTREDIARKIKKAWAPEGIVQENPVLEYCKYIVFGKQENMIIERPEKFGGDVEFNSYEELEKAYESKELFPLDLKNSLVDHLDRFLEPTRQYFEDNQTAKELKEQVESFKVTR